MGKDNQSDLKLLGILIGAAAVLVLLVATLGAPLVAEATAVFAPGMGLRTAALWGFGVTVALFVLFAIVAGDGLLGEIQFMLGSFFGFFVIITLLIAWVF